MQAAGGAPPQGSLPIKILGLISALLLAAILYNSFGSVQVTSHGRPRVREAALPLQKRPRKSRFKEDPNVDAVVEVAHFNQKGLKKPIGTAAASASSTSAQVPPPPPPSPPPLPAQAIERMQAWKGRGSAARSNSSRPWVGRRGKWRGGGGRG